MSKKKFDLKNSRNPIEVIVRKHLGFTGTSAEVLEWSIFLLLLYVIVGLLM